MVVISYPTHTDKHQTLCLTLGSKYSVYVLITFSSMLDCIISLQMLNNIVTHMVSIIAGYKIT